MGTSLPVIRGASALLYPFTMTIAFQTEIAQWQNGAQQRTVKSPGLVRFEWTYGGMSAAQKATLLTFIASSKGRSNGTLQLTLSGTTYTGLVLDSDEWSATEGVSTQYEGTMKLSQKIPQGLSPGTAGTDFRKLANSALGILPYRQKKRYQTLYSEVPAGPSYSTAEFGGGFASYPTDGLMGWDLQESKLSDADLATRIGHFIANWGRAFAFKFTDEDGTPHTKTHYASDELRIQYNGPNDSNVLLALEETF